MKTRSWGLLLGVIALVLAGICLWQLLGQPEASRAEILLDGELIRTVELTEAQRFTVTCAEGYNVIEVADGKIAVVEADCAGCDCVRSGAQNRGAPIICLPHRLVIRFPDSADVDGISG